MFKLSFILVNLIVDDVHFEPSLEPNSNEILEKPTPSLPIFWNVPTFQCNSHKVNFTELATKYHIRQNENDQFRGEVISISYDPGSFPAILKGNTTVYRNGGIPQNGNLNTHLEMFKENVDKLIPDENFAGVGIIDFESWRPIFRQNFGTLAPYKELSIQNEKKLHPFLPRWWIEKEAEKKFEFYAQQFMEETLYYVKQLRPKATWGYYGFPKCFNMAPNNMKTDCPPNIQRENERISWLFNASDNFYPSVYLGANLTPNQRVQLIEGRINEAHRLIGFLKKKERPAIMPYIWYKYHDTKKFLSKDDLFNMFTVLGSSHIDGVILWGSSNDVNTRTKCLELYQYIDEELGPLINIL